MKNKLNFLKMSKEQLAKRLKQALHDKEFFQKALEKANKLIMRLKEK